MPNVFNATSHADANGGKATSSVSDFTFGLPGLPVVQVGSIQATNDGRRGGIHGDGHGHVGRPRHHRGRDPRHLAADRGRVVVVGRHAGHARPPDLHVGDVTVRGHPRLHRQGRRAREHHARRPTAASRRPQAQSTLNSTLAQDGITVRLADPTTTTTGAEGKGDAGGLVVSFTHSVAIPFIPGLPSLPSLPNLGSVGIPAGVYTVTAASHPGLGGHRRRRHGAGPASTTPAGLLGSAADLGTLGARPGPVRRPSTSARWPPPQPHGPGHGAGRAGSTASAPGLADSLFDHLPFGIPAPVGWVVGSLALCVLVMYPMLLIARWQFLGARRR